jgi:hypothetical protein
MASRIQTLTVLPVMILFGLSSLLAIITITVVDFTLKQELLILVSSLFVAGIIYTIYWGYKWIWSKKLHEQENSLFLRIFSNNALFTIVFLALGSITLIWVLQIVYTDLTFWNKDLAQIFFESRINQAISLGVGMRVIHFFLTGLTLLLAGIALLIHRFRSCPYYFGYLGSIYRDDSELSSKCIRCPLKKDCIATDNRSKFQK